jgi:hypothetical protein
MTAIVGVIPAFAYTEPSSQEQSLYNELRSDFENLSISKKDVSDTLRSFSEPIVIYFPCDTGDLHTSVNATIKTKLAKFDSSLAHSEGAITGGIYVWKCSITISGGKMTINCDNEYMLNSAEILKTTTKDPEVKKIEDLVIFYHELLHGQLMIDAIESSNSWRDDTCNKNIQDDLDYSYTDGEHNIITPLQTELASQLIQDLDGVFKVELIQPSETSAGSFSKKVGSLYDYPEYVKSGISISARSYNVANILITSDKKDIIVSGTLNDKAKTGTIWLYIFGKAPQTEPEDTVIEVPPITPTTQSSIPPWIKSNARWWADGTIQNSDFLLGIKYLIEQNVIQIPQTTQGKSSSQQIPSWIKNIASFWADGVTQDSEFIAALQYLIKNGIIQVEIPAKTIPVQSTGVVHSSSESSDLGSVKVNGELFEKKSYQTIQIQISGKVEEFRTGTYVILTITKPDGNSFNLQGIVTGKGQFTVPLMLDGNSPSGLYTILAKYQNIEFATTSFTVQ